MVSDFDSAFHLDYDLKSKGNIFLSTFLLLFLFYSCSSVLAYRGDQKGQFSISWNRLKTITGNLGYQMTSWTKARLEQS